MYPWQGKGEKLDDYDIPRVGSLIGVGEDVVHCVLSVETKGYGFNYNGVTKLFEEHIYYRHLPKNMRQEAVDKGLAYPEWRRNYEDNHNRFLQSYAFHKEAALKACSWGLGQIMGFNHSLAGYDSVLDMVQAFAESEENQLAGMIEFIKTAGLDDELRALEKATDRKTMLNIAARFARGYNGEKYYINRYHIRIVDSLIWWRKVPDTPWEPTHAVMEEEAAIEEHKLDAPAPAPDYVPPISKSSTVWTAIGGAGGTITAVLESIKDMNPWLAGFLILVSVGTAAWIIRERYLKSIIHGV